MLIPPLVCLPCDTPFAHSCAYKRSNLARNLRTSSGVNTDASSDTVGDNRFPPPPLRPPWCGALGSNSRSSLFLSGATGTTSAGTTSRPKLCSRQNCCKSCHGNRKINTQPRMVKALARACCGWVVFRRTNEDKNNSIQKNVDCSVVLVVVIWRNEALSRMND